MLGTATPIPGSEVAEAPTNLDALMQRHQVARRYRLEPPYVLEHDDDVIEVVEVVYVSAIEMTTLNMTVTETYIFPMNADGTDWEPREMTGSYRGGMDHAKALFGLGYLINEPSAAVVHEIVS